MIQPQKFTGNKLSIFIILIELLIIYLLNDGKKIKLLTLDKWIINSSFYCKSIGQLNLACPSSGFTIFPCKIWIRRQRFVFFFLEVVTVTYIVKSKTNITILKALEGKFFAGSIDVV